MSEIAATELANKRPRPPTPPIYPFWYILSAVPWKSESVINFKQCGKFTVIFADMPTSVRDKAAPVWRGGSYGARREGPKVLVACLKSRCVDFRRYIKANAFAPDFVTNC